MRTAIASASHLLNLQTDARDTFAQSARRASTDQQAPSDAANPSPYRRAHHSQQTSGHHSADYSDRPHQNNQHRSWSDHRCYRRTTSSISRSATRGASYPWPNTILTANTYSHHPSVARCPTSSPARRRALPTSSIQQQCPSPTQSQPRQRIHKRIERHARATTTDQPCANPLHRPFYSAKATSASRNSKPRPSPTSALDVCKPSNRLPAELVRSGNESCPKS